MLKKNKQKTLQRLFCACLYRPCLYSSMLMYNSHILNVSSSYIKDGHYTKHKDYLRQSVLQWTKGKEGKEIQKASNLGQYEM